MRKNRVLAVIMAVLMMVTLLPSMVFAAAVPQGALDGKLKVKGTNIADKNGKTVRLKGEARRNYR